MVQFRNSLFIFGGLTRDFEQELKGMDPESFCANEVFVCNLSKYFWTKLDIGYNWATLAFASSVRGSETELLLFGGMQQNGVV